MAWAGVGQGLLGNSAGLEFCLKKYSLFDARACFGATACACCTGSPNTCHDFVMRAGPEEEYYLNDDAENVHARVYKSASAQAWSLGATQVQVSSRSCLASLNFRKPLSSGQINHVSPNAGAKSLLLSVPEKGLPKNLLVGGRGLVPRNAGPRGSF